MPDVRAAGGDVFYTVKKGPESGPQLVLVHGAGGSRLHWPPQMRRMPGVTVYTLDLPGHGRSDGPGCHGIDCYASVVVDFLDEVDAQHAVIAGHSMGGAIALQLGLERDHRVSALVLIATGARLRVAPAIIDGIGEDLERVIDLITDRAWSSEADPSMMSLGRDALREAGPNVLLGDFRACDRFDVMDRVEEIEVPALVVGGTADELTPIKYSRFLADRIPEAQLVTVEGAGHMVILERPGEVADAVRAFLTGSSFYSPRSVAC